jgi:UDP-glucose 4-epimerase
VSRVLVTGGSGFIGSHVVDHLRAAGYEPRILDVRPSPHHAPGEIDTAIADIRDLDAVRAAMRGCDVVVHLAAAADVGEVAAAPVTAEDLNARGTLHVLQAARDVGAQRVIYASTIWVYSDAGVERVDEDSALHPPAHLYTATKLAGELYCRSYGELYGLECTILRFGIPYGPRARPAAVVPAFVGKALRGEPLTIAGDGRQSRRFVYVEDLAQGVIRALVPIAANRTYNLVGDEDVSVRQIADTVRRVVGDVEVLHIDGRPGDFGGVEVCGARAALELDWRPATRFEEGVRRYVAWQREQTAEIAVVQTSRQALAPSATFALGAVGLVAGLLAATMARVEALDDPASSIGLLALLVLPVSFIARIDWTRDRRDALLVAVAMAAGAAIAALASGTTGGLAHFGREHAVVLATLGCGGGAGAIIGVRRSRAARS